MGMSRSGTSLTTSVVAALLGGGRPQTWRGSSKALSSDSANPHGYFERQDAVSLNYATIQALGYSWYTFPAEWASNPKALTAADASSSFRQRATAIVADMRNSSPTAPWVLKDVRFARTLPLWRQLVTGPTACLIPVRHPSEVAHSSKMSITNRELLWFNYMLSALVSARSLGCPTMLVPYHGWLSTAVSSGKPPPNLTSAEAQLESIFDFLKCAGLGGLPSVPPHAALRELVRPDDYHHRDSWQNPSSAKVHC